MEPEPSGSADAPGVADIGSNRPSEVGILYRAIRKGLKDQAHDMAAAVAYYAFFSIFPLLLGIIAVAGYFLDSASLQEQLHDLLTNALPGSGELVRSNLQAVIEARGALGAIGLLGLLWSASSAFGAITRSINRALGAERTRSYFVARARYALMTLAVSVLIVLSLALTASFGIVANPDLGFLKELGIDPGMIGGLGGALMGTAFAFVIFVLIYKETPYVKTRWRQVLPGAILAAVAFELGKHGFVLYLARVANFEAVYGSLSSIIVLLFWLYFSALVLLFGAEYNIVRWRTRTANEQPSQ